MFDSKVLAFLNGAFKRGWTRIVAVAVLLAVGFAGLQVSYTLLNYDPIKAEVENSYKSGAKYYGVVKQVSEVRDDELSWYRYFSALSDSELADAKHALGDRAVISANPHLNFNYWEHLSFTESQYGVNTYDIYNFGLIETDESAVRDFGFDIIGNYPQNADEIALPLAVARLFVDNYYASSRYRYDNPPDILKKISHVEELIGLTLNLSPMSNDSKTTAFTVSGIVDTGETWKFWGPMPDSNLFDYYTESYSFRNYSMACYIFAAKGFTETFYRARQLYVGDVYRTNNFFEFVNADNAVLDFGLMLMVDGTLSGKQLKVSASSASANISIGDTVTLKGRPSWIYGSKFTELNNFTYMGVSDAAIDGIDTQTTKIIYISTEFYEEIIAGYSNTVSALFTKPQSIKEDIELFNALYEYVYPGDIYTQYAATRFSACTDSTLTVRFISLGQLGDYRTDNYTLILNVLLGGSITVIAAMLIAVIFAIKKTVSDKKGYEELKKEAGKAFAARLLTALAMTLLAALLSTIICLILSATLKVAGVYMLITYSINAVMITLAAAAGAAGISALVSDISCAKAKKVVE